MHFLPDTRLVTMGASDKYCSIDNVLLLSFESWLIPQSSNSWVWRPQLSQHGLGYFWLWLCSTNPHSLRKLRITSTLKPLLLWFSLLLVHPPPNIPTLSYSVSSAPSPLPHALLRSTSKQRFPFCVPFFCLLLLICLGLFLLLFGWLGFLVVTMLIVMVFH